MKRGKKGAIELSVTTIIVIVIGVTLLSLGILWVKNTFGKVGELTDDAFKNAQNEITLNTFDDRLTVPVEVPIKKGDTQTLRIYITNDGSTESDVFKIRIEEDEPVQGFSVKMFQTPLGQTKSIRIPEGERKEIRIAIQVDKRATAKSALYNVYVNDGNYDEKGFIVKVI